MAQIFYVHCPVCLGKFPCHPELWEVEYDLLCPFCQHSFPQSASPLVITATGERRGPGLPQPTPAAAPRGAVPVVDPSAHAESM